MAMATMITGVDKICMIMLSNSTSAFTCIVHSRMCGQCTMHVKARVELDNKIIQILLCRPVLSCCCLVVMTWFGNQCIFICLALSCLVLTLLCVTLLCRTITVGSSGRSIESKFWRTDGKSPAKKGSKNQGQYKTTQSKTRQHKALNNILLNTQTL